MKYKFAAMNKKYADEIAYTWKYEGMYSFYDMTEDEEDLNEFLNEQSWNEHYFAVLNCRDELVGFYLFYFEEGIMWMGFGLKPELTGKGHGFNFIIEGVNFGIEKFKYDGKCVMLAVALFNQRAINLYKRLGFEIVNEYMQKTNGGEFEFINMRKFV